MTTLPRGWSSRLVLIGLAVVIAATIGTLGHQPMSSSVTSFGDPSPSTPSAGDILGPAPGGSSTLPISTWTGGPTPGAERAELGSPGQPPDGRRGRVGQAGRAPLRGDRQGSIGEADGFVPNGASVFDDETPAVANLDPTLLEALQRAATEAAKGGVEFKVNSGWRSPKYQEQLLREAVSEYGSEEEAARWVATANTSPHVSGDAVDIGPLDATEWLSEHGARYGLCQIYRNEPWHYELRSEATSRGCPPMYVDPTHDPRMQQ